MVRLTQVHGSFAARVLLARLDDEGIDARCGDRSTAPYRFTVGEMARVDVYVPEDQVEDAPFVLLANEVEDATALPEPPARPGVPPAVGVAALVLVGDRGGRASRRVARYLAG